MKDFFYGAIVTSFIICFLVIIIYGFASIWFSPLPEIYGKIAETSIIIGFLEFIVITSSDWD